MEIERYKDGDGKQKSHRYLNSKYNRAIKEGFYFEAILIAYNLVEDRLIAFLHYAGIVSRDAEELKITKRTKKSIRFLMEKKESERLNVKNIEFKLDVIEKILRQKETEDDYLKELFLQVNSTLDSDEFLAKLIECREWKNARNKYVHGLANKNPLDVENYAEMLAEQGHNLARTFDNYVGKFSRKNNIRRKFKIQ